MRIPQNIPSLTGSESKYLEQLFSQPELFAGRHFMNECEKWFANIFKHSSIYMTTSGTRALELAAIAMGIEPGDEVIMPSYTFVSTANAFVLLGATPVFVDIHPTTMNIDEALVEDAVTERTKAIVAVHYAGVACKLNMLKDIAQKHNLLLLEDNAQGLMASFEDQPLGTFGDLSVISFNYTKHLQAGEAGVLIINNDTLNSKAELAYEAGTNRREFLRKEVDFYEWKSTGSKYFPSEMVNAFILGQLEDAQTIVDKRLQDWDHYYSGLKSLSDLNCIDLPVVPEGCGHNAHIFYIKAADARERKKLLAHLKEAEIYASFHYVPLHNSEFGAQVSRFHGEDHHTTKESGRLIRLPMYHTITAEEINTVIQRIESFYQT